MGTAFQQFFAVLTMAFTALHQFMSAICNVATWTNEASGAFADTSRHDRQMALNKMMAEAGITELPKAAPIALPSATKQLAKPVVAPVKADPAQSDLQLPA